MDLQRLRQRHQDAKGKRKREEGASAIPSVIEPEQPGYVCSLHQVKALR